VHPQPRTQDRADDLASAHAARILAERQLEATIARAERDCEELAARGRDFDRRLQRSKALLRDAGYLRSS
jgi:hypothetical protein